MAAPVPNIISGQAIGGFITVKNSTDLSQLSTQGITIGTLVFNEGTGTYFALSVSTAALVADQVVSVLGIDGWRWIVSNAISGGFAGYAVQYVSPVGNNSHNGSINQPVKTVAMAFSQLASGGSVYVSSGCAWADGSEGLGLTSGQGMRLSGVLANWIVKPAGWLQDKPFNIYGWGLDTSQQFGMNYVDLNWGNQLTNTLDRTDPGIWITATNLPHHAENIFMNACQPYRLGWDYLRKADGTAAFVAASQAVRSGSSTTFTIPQAIALPISQMERSSGTVAAILLPNAITPLLSGLNISITGGTTLFPSGDYKLSGTAFPVGGGRVEVQYVDDKAVTLSVSDNVVASTKTFTITEFDFTGLVGASLIITGAANAGNDGTFVITSVTSAHVVVCSAATGLVNETFSAGVHLTVRYPDESFGPVSGPVLNSHCISTSVPSTPDWIELHPTDTANFAAGMYQVVSVTARTVTVLDPWAGVGGRGGNGTYPNPGNVVLQERFSNGISLDEWRNCGGQTFFGERYNCGPTVDRGSSSGFLGWWYGGYLAGTVWPTGSGPFFQGNLDPNCMASYFVAGGAGGGGVVSVTEDTRLQDGNIRFWGSNGSPLGMYVRAEGVVQDTGGGFSGIPLRPCVEAAAPFVVHLYVYDCQNADDPGPAYGLDIRGCAGNIETHFTKVNRFDFDTGGINGATTGWNFGGTYHFEFESVSLEQRNLIGNATNDGRIAGKRLDAQSQFGVMQNAGLVNLCPAPDTWTVFSGSITVTPNQNTDGLDAAGKAFLVSGVGLLDFTATIPASVIGDNILVGAWYKAPAGHSPLNTGAFMFGGGTNGSLTELNKYCPFGGDGEWQWVSASAPVITAGGGTALTIRFTVNDNFLIYMPTVYYLPISTYSANESFRILHTFRPVPPYLHSGMAGSQTGQKLIAHGGLGTAARYTVGGGAGQITIGAAAAQAIEVFDESGNSLGVLRPSTFTVN